MSSLSAVLGVEVPERLVVALGFGIDAYHGVSHVDVLENLAALDRDGHYLGAFSIPACSPEAAAHLDAVSYAELCTPGRPSIVNPLMAIYFGRHDHPLNFVGETVRRDSGAGQPDRERGCPGGGGPQITDPRSGRPGEHAPV
ncbi:hypothetical protein [Nocardioides speluncae]|uniref:hypothetical protein n=1 Tax=Nocardioides speluncae TaxID=2670337 RepID=UPI0012B1819C|nr:hypothetical protein [Nocardioides speluncae]